MEESLLSTQERSWDTKDVNQQFVLKVEGNKQGAALRPILGSTGIQSQGQGGRAAGDVVYSESVRRHSSGLYSRPGYLPSDPYSAVLLCCFSPWSPADDHTGHLALRCLPLHSDLPPLNPSTLLFLHLCDELPTPIEEPLLLSFRTLTLSLKSVVPSATPSPSLPLILHLTLSPSPFPLTWKQIVLLAPPSFGLYFLPSPASQKVIITHRLHFLPSISAPCSLEQSLTSSKKLTPPPAPHAWASATLAVTATLL